ncbi:MAG: hypothetical protein R8K20_11665 [Gallionellaceae bacterium]
MNKLNFETFEELVKRRELEASGEKEAKEKESDIAIQAKKSARDRANGQRRRFYDEQVQIAAMQEQRRGNVFKHERNDRLSAIRKSHAKDGRTRANLASLHTKEHRFSAILAIIKGLAGKHSKSYCFPGQDTICWLLWRYYGICVSRRTLNYDLQNLDDSGAISRVRRHTRAGRKFRPSSTLYMLTKKGAKMLGLFAKLFKFLRNTRVQNIAQHTSHSSNGERLYGGKPPVSEAERSAAHGLPIPDSYALQTNGI